MNASLVELLGNALPPPYNADCLVSNTFAVSANGMLAYMTENGKIKVGNIRNTEKVATSLNIMGISNEELLNFTNIEFSLDGSTLLFWNSSQVGFIDIPCSLVRNAAAGSVNSDEIEPCSFTRIVEASMEDEGSIHMIAKATFHPSCHHCVVVLHQQAALRLIDLRTLDHQIISLSSGRTFTSFSFGPNIEWLQYTLVLLATNGEIFYLCPIIPNGSIVARSTISDLWAWADQLEYENDPESKLVEDYLSTLQRYLTSMFGPRPLPEESIDLTAVRYIRAGEHTDNETLESFTNNTSTNNLEALEYTPTLVFSNYSPMLVGPITVQRPASELGEDNQVEQAASEGKDYRNSFSGREKACDICIPGAVGGAGSGGGSLRAAAPVLAVSYASGLVDLLVFDSATQGVSSTRSRTAVRGSSYIGPNWRSIDLSLSNLTCSTAGLLVVESVPLSLSSAEASLSMRRRGCEEDEERKTVVWQLLADPVLSHVVHVYCPVSCQAHMLSVSWLEKTIEEDVRQQLAMRRSETGSLRDTSSNTEETECDFDASPLSYPTRVLPVFILPPQSNTSIDTKNKSTTATSESKNNRCDDQYASLSGIAVLHDAMLGHVALFRTSTGLASAVNLTVHTKLCELQDSLESHHGAVELLPMKEELERATNAENIRSRRTQQCLRRVAEGLRAMPEMDTATAAALTPQSSPHNKKVLLEAAQKLERDVLVPLNELAQTTMFNYELLQETYASQVEILEGTAGASSTVDGGSSTGIGKSQPTGGVLSQGLCKLITELDSEHNELVERVKRIQEKFAVQREKAEKHLAFAVSQRAKMSKAEGLYKRQLEDWSRTVSQMNEQVNALRVLSSGSSSVSTTSTPVSTSTQGMSPRRTQPPLFSLSAGSGATEATASPMASRLFRSPAATSIPQSYPQSPSVQSPLPSRTMGRPGGMMFQTPHTAGTTSSRLHRPFSTPTTTTGNVTTPNKAGVTGNTSPLPTTAGAGSAAQFNRQYHTRHPPMPTPSPNFYSAYKARGTGSTSIHSTAGTSAVNGTAGTTRSQFTSPNPASITSPYKETPIITLSQEDQEACNQLLISQTELLEKAEKDLKDLENKLKMIQKQQQNK